MHIADTFEGELVRRLSKTLTQVWYTYMHSLQIYITLEIDKTCFAVLAGDLENCQNQAKNIPVVLSSTPESKFKENRSCNLQ